jgi:hypothetical protein
MKKKINFRDIENIEFVGVATTKVVYLGHALTDLGSKISFKNAIKFH